MFHIEMFHIETKYMWNVDIENITYNAQSAYMLMFNFHNREF